VVDSKELSQHKKIFSLSRGLYPSGLLTWSPTKEFSPAVRATIAAFIAMRKMKFPVLNARMW
jgi:hypothetical protein